MMRRREFIAGLGGAASPGCRGDSPARLYVPWTCPLTNAPAGFLLARPGATAAS